MATPSIENIVQAASVAYGFGTPIPKAVGHALNEEGITSDHPDRDELFKKACSILGTRGGKAKRRSQTKPFEMSELPKMVKESVNAYEGYFENTAAAQPAGFQKRFNPLMAGNAIRYVMGMRKVPKKEWGRVFLQLRTEVGYAIRQKDAEKQLSLLSQDSTTAHHM